LNPNRTLDRSISQLHFNDFVILDPKFGRRLAADEHAVVPDHLRDRVRQFLQPPIVVVPAIIEAVIAMENNFQAVLAGRGTFRCINRLGNYAVCKMNVNGLCRRIGEETVVEEFSPRCLLIILLCPACFSSAPGRM